MKKQTHRPQKLALATHSVRVLTAEDLEKAAGAIAVPTSGGAAQCSGYVCWAVQ